MAEVVASLEGPEDAPVLVLGNPIGTTRAVWDFQAPILSRYFRARSPSQVAAAGGMLRGMNPEGYAGCAEDPAAPPPQGAITARGVIGSRLVVVRGASHFAHYETPGPVTDTLLGHFRATAREH